MHAKLFQIILSFLLVLVHTAASLAAQAVKNPNILILYADDMGYGDLGIQNPDSKIPTPNLDRLAREGMRFTDAHSSSGVCTPSRYALLTGRYHWRAFHSIVDSFGPPVLEDARVTLPEMLKEKGYRTACIGKWHLGWNWDALKRPGAVPDRRTGYALNAFDWSKPIPGGPTAHGFGYYFGDDVPNFPPYTWFENDRLLAAPTELLTNSPPALEGNVECRPGPMAAGWDLGAVMPRLTEQICNWITRQKGGDEPFFLFCPFTSPHSPIMPAAEFRGQSQAGSYGDFVTQTDGTVGRILQALEQNGFRDNTLVVFSSDNGPESFAFERVRKFGHRSMGPLRGLKRDLWEGGHRVPLIIRWPGVVKPGRVSHELISQIDLMATFAALLGFPLTPAMAEDSHDLLPLLRDEQARSPRQAMVHNTNKDHYAIRRGDWLLIEAPSGEVTRPPAWFNQTNGYRTNALSAALFNLRSDLGQRTNLLLTQGEVAAELRSLLKKIRTQGYSAPRLEL